jgi:hypothetical protein|tara:strand:+ start:935 stop:1156 length:222 start_codon:yes stop_codon:yes gene_type:complete
MMDISKEDKLQKEIEEKQQELNNLRYGEVDKAYEDFIKAKEEAVNKYNVWKDACMKRGWNPNNLTFYLRSWKF